MQWNTKRFLTFVALGLMLPGASSAGELVLLENVGSDDIAWSINDSGLIVGTSYSGPFSAAPVRWVDGEAEVLDGPVVLADGTECAFSYGDAREVTNAGDIYGRFWLPGCGGILRAAVWDDDSGAWQAFAPQQGTPFTWTAAPSTAGHVLVGWGNSLTLYKSNKTEPVNIPDGCGVWAMNTAEKFGGWCGDDAAVWDKCELKILPSLGGNNNYVRAINDKGTIVGFAGEGLPGAAVTWPDSDTIEVLHDPGWATSVNNSDTIVGAIGINGDETDPLTPVSWDKYGNATYLAPGQDGIARDINDSGIIVGHVTTNDGGEAFVYFP